MSGGLLTRQHLLKNRQILRMSTRFRTVPCGFQSVGSATLECHGRVAVRRKIPQIRALRTGELTKTGCHGRAAVYAKASQFRELEESRSGLDGVARSGGSRDRTGLRRKSLQNGGFRERAGDFGPIRSPARKSGDKVKCQKARNSGPGWRRGG